MSAVSSGGHYSSKKIHKAMCTGGFLEDHTGPCTEVPENYHHLSWSDTIALSQSCACNSVATAAPALSSSEPPY